MKEGQRSIECGETLRSPLLSQTVRQSPLPTFSSWEIWERPLSDLPQKSGSFQASADSFLITKPLLPVCCLSTSILVSTESAAKSTLSDWRLLCRHRLRQACPFLNNWYLSSTSRAGVVWQSCEKYANNSLAGRSRQNADKMTDQSVG